MKDPGRWGPCVWRGFRRRLLMRRIQWLLGVSLATAAVIVACGDSTTETTPVVDAGADSAVVDSSKPDVGVVDSGLPDTAVEDSAACTADADLNSLNPA